MHAQARGSRTDAGGGDRSVTRQSGRPRRQWRPARRVRGTERPQREHGLLGVADLPWRCHSGGALKRKDSLAEEIARLFDKLAPPLTGPARCRITHSKNLRPLGSSDAGFSTPSPLLAKGTQSVYLS